MRNQKGNLLSPISIPLFQVRSALAMGGALLINLTPIGQTFLPTDELVLFVDVQELLNILVLNFLWMRKRFEDALGSLLEHRTYWRCSNSTVLQLVVEVVFFLFLSELL